MMKWLLTALFLMVFSPSLTVAQVVADGQTSTEVHVATDGHITVDIAPIFSGVDGAVSHNQYSQFNVLAPGVTLDNRVVGARSIVNEVTSTHPSLLTGVLDVKGPRANVIIANPNGVTVNGGRFVNTSGVALSTGVVSYIDRYVSPLSVQRDPVLTTSQGSIMVGEAGLSGALTQLHLIAKEIEIDGPIAIQAGVFDSQVQLVGGDSQVEFNSGMFVLGNMPWAHVIGGDTIAESCADQLCIRVSEMGSISSNHISLLVTGAGAGVSIAGALSATTGDFTLTSEGDIIIAGSVEAGRHGKIVSKNLEIAGDITGGEVRIVSEHTHNLGGEVIATGSLNIVGKRLINDAVQDDAGVWHQGILLALTGSVSVQTTEFLHNSGVIQGMAAEDGIAVKLYSSGEIVNRSLAPEAQALIFASEGDMVIEAGGDIINSAGHMIGHENVVLQGQAVWNMIERADVEQPGEIITYHYTDGSFLFRDREVSGTKVAFGEALVPGLDAVISADSMLSIEAEEVHNSGGDLYAQQGVIEMTAKRVVNELLPTGFAYQEVVCSWWCRSDGVSTLAYAGGSMIAYEDLRINASEQLLNRGGEIVSLTGDMDITSKEVLAQSLSVLDMFKADRGWFQEDVVRLLKYDQGGSFVANMGRLSINSLYAVQLDGGRLLGQEEYIPAGIEVIKEASDDEVRVPGVHVGLLRGML